MSLLAMLPSLLSFGGKLIGNKEKREEFAFKGLELANTLALALINKKTVPWIDGMVKLAYASGTITKGLLRPVFSGGLMVYGLMNPEILERLHGIGAVGDGGILAIFGSFPAWMKSRHDEKKVKKEPVDDYDYSDD